MKSVLDHRVPFDRYFEEISAIPRGSRNEKAIADYVVAFADAHGLEVWRDAWNNVIVKKDGVGAGQGQEPIILQAHLDMVCVKLPQIQHDFEKDPVELILEDNIVRANGTTLGADDGTGVATILGLLAETDLEHPPIEAVFTVQEEIGMIGAQALDYRQLRARRMISMDSGGESESSVNAAGCETIAMTDTLPIQRIFGETITVTVHGLKGGHSGACIDLERANAIRIMANLLQALRREGIDIQLSGMEAGQVSNAIPDTCSATFLTTQVDTALKCIASHTHVLRHVIKDTEPSVAVTASSTGNSVDVIDERDTCRIIDLLTILPNGRQHKSMTISDFVTVSSNVAMIALERGELRVTTSCRAATEFQLDAIETQILRCGEVCGMHAEIEDRTPCWEYMKDSHLRTLAAKLMMDEWNIPLRASYEHGGLECGYFAKNIPGIDIYVIGPIGREVHSPYEWMDLNSCHRVYEFMKKYLTLLTEV